ncbi:MAG: hypothetical protein OIF50_14900 [Flavobacteriaceae bacterium]|nr:hypothetical protein [Flavobacteriaceae bacterium]
MKRSYKIILVFVLIFLLGIGFWIGYVNYSYDKKEASKPAQTDSAMLAPRTWKG